MVATKKPAPRQTTRKTSGRKKTESAKRVPDSGPVPQPARSVRGGSFPIVGIGASAGGLEAFEAFFRVMPEDSGAAFVLVSHLDPNHASILPELIQKKTAMPVHQIKDNMKVAPNQVFIIPPNREMAILHGALQLLELSQPRGSNLPIDIFFRSLALDQGDRAIGIILSGTGTDGTLGVRAIKGEGGMVMAQDMESAKYDGMPGSVIATGLVDYILAPDKMPEQLAKYVRHQSRNQPVTTPADNADMQSWLQKIYVLLRAATGHDFSQYKPNTICRRIERRMHVHQIDNVGDYVRYLKESDQESAILFKELLIGVTSFFRDPEAFQVLKERYLPGLLSNRPEDAPVRIWVPGCSSGEEAYSIAIIAQECMTAMGRRFSVQVFGTDLDAEAITMARAGIYPESVAADVSQERLQKFFTKSENRYQIKKNIREMVVFAPQNIIKDPPFTKLDLLSCRNLLIYFGPELQKRLLPMFHYSLKVGGLLFLGSSETIGLGTDLFATLDKKWKIYKRHPSERAARRVLDFPLVGPGGQAAEQETRQSAGQLKESNPLNLLKTIISQSDMSTCVVIDDHGNIIYIHGRTGCFLEPAEGEASLNILEMARPGLKAGLTGAIRSMAAERQEVVVRGLQARDNGGSVEVNLIVRPMPDLHTGRRGLMLVIFEHSPPADAKAVKPAGAKRPTRGAELKKLEDELQYTKENLQTTIEELETANEELKSTNEELQSTNEELQSTNEELETSKEELQSLNEESATVNSELQGRIDELVTANDDMKNLLDATEIATIFLDIDLRIRRFTPKTTELIPLAAVDIGRPISHFATRLQGVDLAAHAGEVLRDLGKQEIDVKDLSGKIFRMRVRPYRTVNNVIDGVVIIFDDISALKQLAQERRLAAIVKDSNDAITLHDFSGNILVWNKGAEKMYGYSAAEAVQMNILDTVPRDQQDAAWTMIVRLKGEDVPPSETERLRKDGTSVVVWRTISRIMDDRGRPEFVATTERDLSLLNREAFLRLTGEPHDR